MKQQWGGARPGAGRPPSAGRTSSEPHQRRPRVDAGVPVIVVARVVRAVGDLRRVRASTAIARAIDQAHVRTDFRIVEHVTDNRGIELVVEADDWIALARGMQGFQVAAARALNALAARRGTVFADRYKIVRARR